MAETGIVTNDPTLGRLPKLWMGFILSGVVAVAETLDVALGPSWDTVFDTAVIGSWCYWLFCVFRFHDVVGSVQGYRHPITPARAVAMHFVPLYNLYWVFRWPSRIALFVNWRTQSNSMKGWIPGILVLGSVIMIRLIDGFVGCVMLFSAGAYISSWIRRAAKAGPVPSSAMAPPPYPQILPLS